MDLWPFITAAYAVALGGTALLVGVSYFGMRRAERAADQLKERRE
jgi:hypothetical protein